MLDVFLILMGILCLITGLAGCFLPVIPGPPVAYAGLLLLHFTGKVQYSATQLLLWLLIVVIVQVLDYFVPHAGQQIQRRNALGNARMPCRNPHRAVLHALGHCPWSVFRGFYRRTFRRQGNPAGSEVGTGLPVRLPLRYGTEMRVVRILRMGVCIGTALT